MLHYYLKLKKKCVIQSFSSVQFSHSVMFSSLWPHGLQHTRPRCLSPTPGVYSNSCPLSQWCHQPSHPLSSPSPPAFSLAQHQGLFKWVSSSHQVAKVLEYFSFNISPCNEYSGLISFRMDWLDLLAVQGTLKSLLQHHSSNASILWCSAFFIVQQSFKYYLIHFLQYFVVVVFETKEYVSWRNINP